MEEPAEALLQADTGISPEAAASEDFTFPMRFKWSGQTLAIHISDTDTVGDLKAMLWSITSVPVERQKLLLLKGKLESDDSVVIQDLNLGPPEKFKIFTLIGTPEGQEHKYEAGPPLENEDIDIHQTAPSKAALSKKNIDPAKLEKRNKRKLMEACDKLTINIMNPPRVGKKLLVLDLDYTILDTKAWQEPGFTAREFVRPGLNAFLESVYPHYDIVVWSQTSWRWLESKCLELGMIGWEAELEHAYRVSFVLDRDPMFSVYSMRKNGESYKHEVKALEILWRKFPEHYGPHSSIHIDDLGRNFVLNPQQGLKILPFKNARNNQNDAELPALARYLVSIASMDDLRSLDHSQWKQHPSQS